MKKIKFITSLFLMISVISIFFYTYYTTQTTTLEKKIYLESSNKLKNEFKKLVKQKQGNTRVLTYILGQSDNFKNALLTYNYDRVKFDTIVNGLKKYSNYKNIWLQLVDSDGYCLYRSWTKRYGDNVLAARKDLQKVFKNPKHLDIISTGKFDMTFKTIEPIYNNGKLIGIVEMISHFNSIAKRLKEQLIEPLIIVDKSYKQQFIKPFTNMFINDYYIANQNASGKLIQYVKTTGLEQFLNIKDYLIINNYLVTTYQIKNINNEPMSYNILFYSLTDIDMTELNQLKIDLLSKHIALMIILLLIMITLVDRKYMTQLNTLVDEKTKDLKKQQIKLNSLLEAYDNNIIFSRTDLKGYITHVSDAFCEVSGYTRDELMGKNHNIVRHPDMPKSAFEKLWIALKNKEKITIEIKNKKKDGGSYWVMAKFEPLYDENDNHIGYSAIRQNITAQKEVELLQKEIQNTQKEIIFTMGSIGESRSKETANHVKRVAKYSKILALGYGLNEEEANMLKEASPMHDIGKVGIPDSILNKPDILTDQERDQMKRHAELGYSMLKTSNRPLLKMASTIAYTHHEKWDGTGYPNGLKGENISIYGRITAVADVFDALGSNRCYKKAWKDDKIFKLFKEEKGKHFDPRLIEIFFDNIEEILKIRDKFKDYEQ